VAAAGGGSVGQGPAGGVGPTDVGMMDAVMQALEQQSAGVNAGVNGGVNGKHPYVDGDRETMTPSPTGPLDAGGFFNMMEH
jgi:hypothetical protein